MIILQYENFVRQFNGKDWRGNVRRCVRFIERTETGAPQPISKELKPKIVSITLLGESAMTLRLISFPSVCYLARSDEPWRKNSMDHYAGVSLQVLLTKLSVCGYRVEGEIRSEYKWRSGKKLETASESLKP